MYKNAEWATMEAHVENKLQHAEAKNNFLWGIQRERVERGVKSRLQVDLCTPQ